MRSKVNFATKSTKDGSVFNKNLNGELIDVSIIDLKLKNAWYVSS